MDTTELVQEYKDIDGIRKKESLRSPSKGLARQGRNGADTAAESKTARSPSGCREAKKQKDKEDRRLIRRTLREIERQKQKDLREKLEYRETVRRITAVSQQEQQKAQMREEEEKKEDLRFLKESLRLEKESEARRLAERQRHVEAHQSRADRIAPTTRVDKVTHLPCVSLHRLQHIWFVSRLTHVAGSYLCKVSWRSHQAEAATRSAIARYTKEQAELEKKELEQRQRKKQAAEDNTEYLKRQVQERQDRKKAEAEERRKIQQEQEEDAKAYKIETEAKERNKRLENMKQQNLLLQQIEEHKRRTDMSVSPTEIKLNRALLEQVKEFKSNHLSRALPRRCQKDDSDSDDN
ncbi:hypothetical protein TGVEG_441010 [Toxoplasma gondii VEG]|uniref:Uncharacterized protein n=1 Tax=Toxoplasma gondii (strain ATCC 50861 / VEG) TaxID=432359 RepID=V5B5K7_TOXGV|nr:hypothetical protein TGVEG_441010 [Toxoplasma gondii VEG]